MTDNDDNHDVSKIIDESTYWYCNNESVFELGSQPYKKLSFSIFLNVSGLSGALSTEA